MPIRQRPARRAQKSKTPVVVIGAFLLIVLAMFVLWMIGTPVYAQQAPPSRYDHPYRGKLTIRDATLAQTQVLCPVYTPGMMRWACAWVRKGSCTVIVSTDQNRFSREGLLRHELAHCNGWPANHPL